MEGNIGIRMLAISCISRVRPIEPALFLADGSRISTIEKISTLKERIGDEIFMQCHQSYLVNMVYIADIQKEVLIVLNQPEEDTSQLARLKN